MTAQVSNDRPLRYPTERIRAVALADGSTAVLRPLLPQDATLLGGWFEQQPAAERRRRFHGAVGRLSAERLALLTSVDHEQHVAFGLVRADGLHEQVLAEARYVRHADDPLRAEFAILVDSRCRRQGLGALAMHALLQCAADHGVQWLFGHVQADNAAMQRLGLDCGFLLSPDPADEDMVRLEIAVPPAAALLSLPPRSRRSWLRQRVVALARQWRGLNGRLLERSAAPGWAPMGDRP